jgi:hypothetical protein
VRVASSLERAEVSVTPAIASASASVRAGRARAMAGSRSPGIRYDNHPLAASAPGHPYRPCVSNRPILRISAWALNPATTGSANLRLARSHSSARRRSRDERSATQALVSSLVWSATPSTSRRSSRSRRSAWPATVSTSAGRVLALGMNPDPRSGPRPASSRAGSGKRYGSLSRRNPRPLRSLVRRQPLIPGQILSCDRSHRFARTMAKSGHATRTRVAPAMSSLRDCSMKERE